MFGWVRGRVYFVGMQMINDITGDVTKTLNSEIDAEIRKRIIALGVDPDNLEYLKCNFYMMDKEGDEFKHLFFIPQDKFVISIQKVPTLEFKYTTNDDLVNNVITITMSYKYY